MYETCCEAAFEKYNSCTRVVEKMLWRCLQIATLDNQASSPYNTSEINRSQQPRKVVIPLENSHAYFPVGRKAHDDTVHEIGRDEARHGKAFAGLLKRYFGK